MNAKHKMARSAVLLAPISLAALLGADGAAARDPIQPDPVVSSRTTRSAPDAALPAPDTTGLMKELDANRDNFISRDEAMNDDRVQRIFPSADEDGDGRLSAVELSEGFRG
jgi:hypothetical protein